MKLHPTLWTSEKSHFHLNLERTSFTTKHIGIHNESESLKLKASYFEIIDTIQSEFSHRFLEFDMSLIKSFRVLSPELNCFLDKEELQPLYSLVNSTTKNISEDLLDAETTTVKSIVSSNLPDVFLNEKTRMSLDQFMKWFWKYKSAFPTIYLLLNAGLTAGFRQPCFTARVLSWFINASSITHVHERLGRKHATIVLKG